MKLNKVIISVVVSFTQFTMAYGEDIYIVGDLASGSRSSIEAALGSGNYQVTIDNPDSLRRLMHGAPSLGGQNVYTPPSTSTSSIGTVTYSEAEGGEATLLTQSWEALTSFFGFSEEGGDGDNEDLSQTESVSEQPESVSSPSTVSFSGLGDIEIKKDGNGVSRSYLRFKFKPDSNAQLWFEIFAEIKKDGAYLNAAQAGQFLNTRVVFDNVDVSSTTPISVAVSPAGNQGSSFPISYGSGSTITPIRTQFHRSNTTGEGDLTSGDGSSTETSIKYYSPTSESKESFGD